MHFTCRTPCLANASGQMGNLHLLALGKLNSMSSWCTELSDYMGGWCRRKLNSMGGWCRRKLNSMGGWVKKKCLLPPPGVFFWNSPESTLVKMPLCWKSRHGSYVSTYFTHNFAQDGINFLAFFPEFMDWIFVLLRLIQQLKPITRSFCNTLLLVLLKIVIKCLVIWADTASDSKTITTCSWDPISALVCIHIGPLVYPQRHK